MEMKLKNKFLVIVLLAALCGFSNSAVSADGVVERIRDKMQVLSATTFRHKNNKIKLWGVTPIQPANSIYYLKAIILLEETAKRNLNCKVVGGKAPNLVARCISADDLDLGLALINKGLALVDREDIGVSEFSQIYMDAEKGASQNGQGIWEQVREKKNKNLTEMIKGRLPKEITVLDLLVIPSIIMLIAFTIIWLWMRRMDNAQKKELERLRYKELMLQAREKNILITLLKYELEENKDKILGFLTVYKDMLSNVKDENKNPDYKPTGETIQQHPFFTKDVFEANLGKLTVLDMRMANYLSKLYKALPTESEYIELEVNSSREDAVKLLSHVIDDAQEWLMKIEKTILDLDKSSDENSSLYV